MMMQTPQIQATGSSAIKRVFYADGGGGNLIAAHEAWCSGIQDPTEVSITFSSQIADYVQGLGAEGYFVTPRAEAKTAEFEGFTIEQRPKKPRSGLRYHLSELAYGWGLARTAKRFKADIAFIDTGAAPMFTLSFFRLFGIPVVPILHNALWPANFPPSRPMPRFIRWLDRRFWRHGASGAIGVSPECERQVRGEAPNASYPILQIRAQFHRNYFEKIPPAPPHDGSQPFRVMFIGRVNRHKGTLDILEMAQSLEKTDPGRVHWTICGRGPDFDELVARHEAMGLHKAVEIAGWVSLEQLEEIYARSHASIVPTRSGFAEGLAMTAAEAVLAGRPVILNPVVPAIDLIGPACLAGKTNDPESHAEQVRRLARDPALYRSLIDGCEACRAPFYDRYEGLTAGLFKISEALGLWKGDIRWVSRSPQP